MFFVEDNMRIWLGAETVTERAFGLVLIDYETENGWRAINTTQINDMNLDLKNRNLIMKMKKKWKRLALCCCS